VRYGKHHLSIYLLSLELEYFIIESR
jgi:hypothetical protein